MASFTQLPSGATYVARKYTSPIGATGTSIRAVAVPVEVGTVECRVKETPSVDR